MPINIKKNLAQPFLLRFKIATKKKDKIALYKDLVNKGLKFLPFWNMINNYHYDYDYNDNDDNLNLDDDDLDNNNNNNNYYDYYDYDQYRNEIISAIENWLKPNSVDILMDNFYVKFVAFVCLIGCSSLQHSKKPWNHITIAIEKLNNEEIRSHFIKDLEALYQTHKYGSEMFYLKLADLIVNYAKD